jgi:hypothetical protein
MNTPSSAWLAGVLDTETVNCAPPPECQPGMRPVAAQPRQCAPAPRAQSDGRLVSSAGSAVLWRRARMPRAHVAAARFSSGRGGGPRELVESVVPVTCGAGGAGAARACPVAGRTAAERQQPAGRCRHPGRPRRHGRAGCAWSGAGTTRLVPEGLPGGPSGSSFPAPAFTAMLVPCHDLKLRICSQVANQRAPT